MRPLVTPTYAETCLRLSYTQFAPGELDAIFAAFERPGTPPENGVKINGIKYIYIRPSDDGAGIQLKHSVSPNSILPLGLFQLAF